MTCQVTGCPMPNHDDAGNSDAFLWKLNRAPALAHALAGLVEAARGVNDCSTIRCADGECTGVLWTALAAAEEALKP